MHICSYLIVAGPLRARPQGQFPLGGGELVPHFPQSVLCFNCERMLCTKDKLRATDYVGGNALGLEIVGPILFVVGLLVLVIAFVNKGYSIVQAKSESLLVVRPE